MKNLGYYIIEDLMSKESCQKFTKKIIKESKLDLSNPRKNFMIHPSIPGDSVDNKEWDPKQEFNKIIKFAEKFIKEKYDLTKNTFELKRFFFHTMLEGAKIEAHADDGDEYPNKPKDESHYSAVFVLNENYEGGEMSFPNLKTKHKLKEGSLIIFPGDVKRTHEVEIIKKGFRVSMPIFFRNYTK